MNQSQAEATIKYLVEKKGVQVQDIADRLSLTRNQLNSWRRSNQEKRIKELLKKILDVYAEYFPDGVMPDGVIPKNVGRSENETEAKYIALLERKLKEAESALLEIKTERNRLREQVTAQVSQLERDIP